MARVKLRLAWIRQNSIRRPTFRKLRSSLLEEVRQLSLTSDVKACAIIYDPSQTKGQKPETWPSEEETREMLSNFMSMPGKNTMNHEEYLRQRVAKLEERHSRILSDNNEKLLTIFLQGCLVGERSVTELKTVDEAQCLMRIIDQKLMTVKERTEKIIEKGKMVIVDSDMKNLSTVEANAPMIDDDSFWSCYDSSNRLEDSSWMGADYDIANGDSDGLFGSFLGSNGDGGLDEGIRQSGCFYVGESSSSIGPSSS